MNNDYEIIRLKLEDSHQPVRYFTPEFYELYCEYRKQKLSGSTLNTRLYESMRETDFFLKTPSAFSEFVRIYRERLPRWCIDFKKAPSDRHIEKRMIDRFEDVECAEKYARRWTMFFGEFYEISKVA